MRHDATWLAAAARGQLLSAPSKALSTDRICVDTRVLKEGDIFIALPGSRANGRDFIAAAVEQGAAGIIAEPAAIAQVNRDLITIAVEDSSAALYSIARAQRAEFAGHAIAITGSCGKTTTTAILASLLRSSMPTHATREGFNTHRGVAATIASLPEDVLAMVVELSMQAKGHIAEKADLLEPTAALITNIAAVHLQTTGSVAEVARNKAELIAALPPAAVCVVPSNEPLLDPYLRDDLTTIRHGDGGDFSLRSFRAGVASIDCAGETITVRPGFSQPHNLANLVAAIALLGGLGLGPPTEPEFVLPPLRWQIKRIDGVELVLDCFNASPEALGAAFEAFAAEPAKRRIAVLAAFEELGPRSGTYHRAAGAKAARLGIDAIIAVGDRAGEYLRDYRGERYLVNSPEQARDILKRIARGGDRILVKGARAAELERIAP